MRRAGVVLVVALAVSATTSPAIDWDRRLVRCSGMSAPTLREETENVTVTFERTQRAARAEAARACLATLRGITVAGALTAGALLDGDPVLARAVERIVRSSPTADAPRLFSDGGVALEVVLPLDGRLTETLLTAALGRPGEEPADGRSGAPVPESGVIVDARGLELTPALGPRILGADGAELYGPATLAPAARGRGGAAYVRDVETARKDHSPRLGPAPRVVKALRSSGADVVVSAADAASLRGRRYLSQGRVVIVRAP